MSETEVPNLSKIPIGACISLITSVQFRYEGTVAAINSIDNTITLKGVRFWGAENRVSGSAATQTGDNDGPAIGSLFDSVTFWMSSVIKLLIREDNSAKNELGDSAIKATTSMDANTTLRKKQTNQASDSATSSRNSRRPSNNDRHSDRQPLSQPQRQVLSYPRRGRNQLSPKQPYMSFNAVQEQTYNSGRNGYVTPMRGVPYHMRNNVGRQNGINRRSVPSNEYGRRSFTHNPGSSGMFVYLPAEVAAAYQPRGMQIYPQRGYNPPVRRRHNERRNGPPRSLASENVQDMDCSSPYDFETANAELEAELAKINLNIDSAGEQDLLSSGDRQFPSTNADASTYTGAASGSGASGDSSSGAVTANMVASESAPSSNTDSLPVLAKGEFYVREKCFFDQISRSEGGPRGPTGGIRGNFNSDRGRFTSFSQSRQLASPGNNGSSISTARRERQLNIETFGQLAARSIYNQRRRPTGSVPRDLLVSATA